MRKYVGGRERNVADRVHIAVRPVLHSGWLLPPARARTTCVGRVASEKCTCTLLCQDGGPCRRQSSICRLHARVPRDTRSVARPGVRVSGDSAGCSDPRASAVQFGSSYRTLRPAQGCSHAPVGRCIAVGSRDDASSPRCRNAVGRDSSARSRLSTITQPIWCALSGRRDRVIQLLGICLVASRGTLRQGSIEGSSLAAGSIRIRHACIDVLQPLRLANAGVRRRG